MQIWLAVASKTIPAELRPLMHALYQELAAEAPPIAELLEGRFGRSSLYSSHAHRALLRLLARAPPEDDCPPGRSSEL